MRDYIAVTPAIPVSDQELRDNIANRLRHDRIGYGIMFNDFQVGVKDGVVDDVTVLPLSDFDDELRVRTASAVYGDPTLRKYAIDPQAPIRIVVEHGDVKLYDVVDSAMNKQIAEMKARQVSGVFSVENHLLVANEPEQKGR